MKSKLLSIHHFIVSVILISKGFNKIQHHHSFIGWTILLLGIIVLSYFIFVKLVKKPHSTLDVIIHFFESMALFLTSYIYFQDGKSFLPYVTLIAGIGFLVATFIHLKGHKKHTN